MLSKKMAILQWIIAVIVMVMINLLAGHFYIRFDFTEDRRFTPEKETIEMLQNLSRPVTVHAWFSEGLPPELLPVRNEFRDLLAEFHYRSNGQFVYAFNDPSESPKKEADLQEKGLEARILNVRDRGEVTRRRIFMGAILEAGEETAIIPFIEPGTGIEYELTRRLNKIAFDHPNSIGLLNIMGSAEKKDFKEIYQRLKMYYHTAELTLDDDWEKFDALVLIDPVDSVSGNELNRLDSYINQGGGLFLAYAPLKAEWETYLAETNKTGLESWLSKWGIEMHNSILIDSHCGSVNIPQDIGGERQFARVSFPFFPVITNFYKHPITTGLKSVFMPWTSTVSVHQDIAMNSSPVALAFSSDLSGRRELPLFINLEKRWTRTDFDEQNIPVLAAVESDRPEMVVAGSGNFALTEQGAGQSKDNINLVLNSIDWLTGNERFARLRSKHPEARPLRSTEPATTTLLKYVNAFLPGLLVLLFGLYRFLVQVKKRRRLKSIVNS